MKIYNFNENVGKFYQDNLGNFEFFITNIEDIEKFKSELNKQDFKDSKSLDIIVNLKKI